MSEKVKLVLPDENGEAKFIKKDVDILEIKNLAMKHIGRVNKNAFFGWAGGRWLFTGCDVGIDHIGTFVFCFRLDGWNPKIFIPHRETFSAIWLYRLFRIRRRTGSIEQVGIYKKNDFDELGLTIDNYVSTGAFKNIFAQISGPEQ